ncbi:MAG: hypothetical protein IMZ64_10340, partial [Bacteroidetes bacterium]|nr:hypothetical protein [Bacteroidota bacterium]
NYNENHNYYIDQSSRDISLRSRYVEGIPFERDWKEHGRILLQSFKKVFDLTYYEIMFTLSDIIINTKEIKSVNDIPFVTRNCKCTVFGNLGCTENGNKNVHFT